MTVTRLCNRRPSRQPLRSPSSATASCRQRHNNPVAPFDRALNAGISGQTTEEIADRVTAAAPIVFLEGGTNDLTRNLPLDEIVSNYRRMLDKLTGVRVVIIGIPPSMKACSVAVVCC